MSTYRAVAACELYPDTRCVIEDGKARPITADDLEATIYSALRHANAGDSVELAGPDTEFRIE